MTTRMPPSRSHLLSPLAAPADAEFGELMVADGGSWRAVTVSGPNGLVSGASDGTAVV